MYDGKNVLSWVLCDIRMHICLQYTTIQQCTGDKRQMVVLNFRLDNSFEKMSDQSLCLIYMSLNIRKIIWKWWVIDYCFPLCYYPVVSRPQEGNGWQQCYKIRWGFWLENEELWLLLHLFYLHFCDIYRCLVESLLYYLRIRSFDLYDEMEF